MNAIVHLTTMGESASGLEGASLSGPTTRGQALRRKLQSEAQEGDRDRNGRAPTVACAGEGSVRLGPGLEIEGRDRCSGQPEAAQRIALLFLSLGHRRGAVAQSFAGRTAVIALVIVRSSLYFLRLSNLSLTAPHMRHGCDPMARSRVHNACIDDGASQGKQPDQQYMDCKSAKTLGLSEHWSDYLGIAREDMDEDTFGGHG